MRSISFPLRTETIELQQLLKATDLINSGGDVRGFLAEVPVTVNGEAENRRGRKLRIGDVVVVEDAVEIRLEQV